MAEAGEISLDLQGDRTDQKSLQKHDQTTEELQSSLSTLTLRINQHLSRCAELSMDLLDIETDMAVLCDSDLSGLEGLREQQDDLEAHYHNIEEEVRDMERLASQLQVPPPEQRDLLREEVQAILQAWEEVGRNMAENRGRLFFLKFHHIQDFFKNHLAMITWTENTRTYVLHGTAARRESEVAEMHCRIETKLDEFNKLAAAGQTLIQEETQFKDIIKERTDELQSMLRWIQVNWRTQREQLKGEQNERPERTNDLVQQKTMLLKKMPSDSLCIVNREGIGGTIKTEPSQNNCKQKTGSQDVSSVVSQESCLAKTSLGSSICLILSFDEQSSEINQVTKQWSPNNNEVHCITNDITLSTPKKEQIEESTSNIHVHTQQLQDNNPMQMQQTLEMLPNVSSISEETEHKSSCGFIAQEHKSTNNTNQGQPVQSPSQSSPCNIQPSFCNPLAEDLRSPVNNQMPLQLSPSMDQIQNPELSVMHQVQNQQLPRYNKEWTKQSHSDRATNKTPSDKLQVLENHSNDLLHQEEPAEVTHRVFTYLHVSDNYKSPSHAAGEGITTSALCSPSVSLSSTHSSSLHSQNVTTDGGTVCNHKRFKASSVFSLKEPIRSKKGERRRHSTLGNIRSERSGEPSNIFRQRCNTWPEGERRSQESQVNSRPQVLIKESMLPVYSVNYDKPTTFPGDNLPKTIKTPSRPVKNICSYLSLGSTLSFSLPKRFHNRVSDLENKENIGPALIYDNPSDSKNQPLCSSQTPVELEPVIYTKQTELHPNEVCEDLTLEDLEETINDVEDVHNRTCEKTEPVLMQARVATPVEHPPLQHSGPDNQKPALNSCNDSSSHHKVNTAASPSSSTCGHKCLSVYTKIHDLNGHLYHAFKHKKMSSPSHTLSNGQEASGYRKSVRVINCGVRDCAVCFNDTVKENEEMRVTCAEKPDINLEAVLQPGHWLFQQEEEELKDIWRGRVGNLTSNSTVESNMDEETGLSINTNWGHVTHALYG
ncbi:uncharacterized protein LOC127427820 [Myxocyprinus asiaticus]|uniref:uncharacterized protein LOC127427820 n=1 Tax=Myxocyprinus asiaticus TaxID=70543 RepID=UPI0022239EB6|nr:uncharacterized protein LOC127427820 [Myxocyprinus asiaticus]